MNVMHREIGLCILQQVSDHNNLWTMPKCVHSVVPCVLFPVGHVSVGLALVNAYFHCYPFVSSEYFAVLCLFSHHVWIGGFPVLGVCVHLGLLFNLEYCVIVC